MDLFVRRIPEVVVQGYLLYNLPADFDYDHTGQFLENLDNVKFLTIGISKWLHYSYKFEKLLIAFERCKAYEELPSEEGYKTVEQDALTFEVPSQNMEKTLEKVKNVRRSTVFTGGKVEFRNVSACYETNKTDTLKNLSFVINKGE